MKKIALIYGGIAGTFVIGSMILGFITSDGKGAASSQAFGYAIMFVALSLVFLGIKKHRDTDLGGVIRFWPAFGLGLMISAIAGVMYVVCWEIYLALTDHQFIETYIQGVMDAKRATGVSAEELAKVSEKMEDMKTLYGKAWYRLPITFSEIFPVGALIALISAAVLRNPNVLPAKAKG